MSVPALRPMTVGDILDQAFSLYRKNFITLVGIVAVVHVPLLVLEIAGSLLFGTQLLNRTGPSVFTQAPSAATLGGIGILVLTVVVAGLAQVFETSALSVVVSERLLGNTINLRQAYGRALSRWRALFAMIFIIGGATVAFLLLLFIPVGIFAVLIGVVLGTGSNSATGGLISAGIVCMTCLALPIGLIATYGLSVRLLFTPQAIVLEKLGGIEGLRRSWRLVRGSFWRVLGITLVLSILVAIIGQGPAYVITIVASALPFPALGIVINAVTQALINIVVLPLEFAAFTLLYYDLRIRKEGFDLQLMAEQLRPSLSGLSSDSGGDIVAA